MHRLRSFALLGVVVVVAAATLAGCSQPATSFHIVGVTPFTSTVVPGEQQLWAGDHTFAVDRNELNGMGWEVTWGATPAADTTAVLSDELHPTITVNFAAQPQLKVYYRVCLFELSNRASQTCKVYAVGDGSYWPGSYVSVDKPIGIVTSLDGRDLTVEVGTPHGGTTWTAPLSSPFVFTPSAPDDGTTVPPGAKPPTFEWNGGAVVLKTADFETTLVRQPSP